MTHSHAGASVEDDASEDQFERAFSQELERRLAILAPDGGDVTPLGEFNRYDYLLMLLLGLVLPALALLWGWN